MIEQKHLTGSVVRVYDPPLPIGPADGPGFRDFDATKVEIAPDGTMTLSKIEQTGEELDVRSGRMMQGYKATLLAVVDADGHLRAETIILESARRQVQLADGSSAPNESVLDR